MDTPRVFLRSNKLFDPERDQIHVTIIGVGMTGSYTAFLLAKMGVSNITIFDGDVVEHHNWPNQLHAFADVGRSKVEATENMIKGMLPPDWEFSLNKNNEHFTADTKLTPGIVVCAVDSMEARNTIWNVVKGNPRCQLFIDPRVGGGYYELFATNPCSPDHIKRYEQSLFYTDEEADRLPCGTEAPPEQGFIVAGQIVKAIRQYVKEEKLFPHIMDDGVNHVLPFGTDPVGPLE